MCHESVLLIWLETNTYKFLIISLEGRQKQINWDIFISMEINADNHMNRDANKWMEMNRLKSEPTPWR